MRLLVFLAHCARTGVAIALLGAVFLAGDIAGYIFKGETAAGPSDHQFIEVRHELTPAPLDLERRRLALASSELCFSKISAQARSNDPELNRMIGRLHDTFGHDLIAVARSDRSIRVIPLPPSHPWLAGMTVPSCLTRKEDYPAILRTSLNPQ
jgi:signal transduction histidine kinase